MSQGGPKLFIHPLRLKQVRNRTECPGLSSAAFTADISRLEPNCCCSDGLIGCWGITDLKISINEDRTDFYGPSLQLIIIITCFLQSNSLLWFNLLKTQTTTTTFSKIFGLKMNTACERAAFCSCRPLCQILLFILCYCLLSASPSFVRSFLGKK